LLSHRRWELHVWEQPTLRKRRVSSKRNSSMAWLLLQLLLLQGTVKRRPVFSWSVQSLLCSELLHSLMS